MGRPHPPRTPIERDVVEAEASLNDFAERSPDVAVTVMRFANVLGPDVRTSHIELFGLPAVPMILGFDPRYQFVHEDDVVHALEHAVRHRLPGVYNVAADGVLALSEVAGLLGKRYAPVLPPWGTGLAAAGLRRLGVRIPPEAMNQLRYGRGVDNRRYKAAGFGYQHTSRETVLRLGEHMRLHPVVRGLQEPYRYEREVEEFLRWSPHVRNSRDRRTPALDRVPPAGDDGDRLAAAEARAASAERNAQRAVDRAKKAERRAAQSALKATERAKKAERRAIRAAEEAVERAEQISRQNVAAGPPAAVVAGGPVEHYDDLAADELIALLASLEREDLETLREYESRNANRVAVISAIDSVISRG